MNKAIVITAASGFLLMLSALGFQVADFELSPSQCCHHRSTLKIAMFLSGGMGFACTFLLIVLVAIDMLRKDDLN